MQQAKLYADCLERQFGQRPVIFYTNGYDTWLWDDERYPPRRVQGFYTKDELALLIQRRTARRSLADTEIRSPIVDRHYQQRAIRRIGEAFERDHQRKALVVMATGAGKTRTVIALVDLLMRAGGLSAYCSSPIAWRLSTRRSAPSRRTCPTRAPSTW